MRKNYLFLALFLLFFFPLCVFAESARIIDLKGNVLVKLGQDRWQKAKMNMLLGKDTEIETKDNSYCTLAFDEEQKNILTIKSRSRLKIESIKPGSLFLPEGRVFALIENLAKQEKFEVRTPTAVAGARGTGWLTYFHVNQTGVYCFLDTVYTQGRDNAGNSTGEKDVPSGNGLNIGEAGIFGELFNLRDTDYAEWNDFLGYLRDLIDKGDAYSEGDSGSPLEDLLQDQREDYGDILSEGRRKQTESGQSTQERQQDGGGGGGGGDSQEY